jgi:hypothetical protein
MMNGNMNVKLKDVQLVKNFTTSYGFQVFMTVKYTDIARQLQINFNCFLNYYSQRHVSAGIFIVRNITQKASAGYIVYYSNMAMSVETRFTAL